MPRFFFDLQGSSEMTDPDGVVLADESEAISEGKEAAAELREDMLSLGRRVDETFVVVRDRYAKILAKIPLDEEAEG